MDAVTAIEHSDTVNDVVFDEHLIARYDGRGPRYTSYPTAVQFQDSFTAADYAEQANQSNHQLIPKPLSLYLHLPFCGTVCYYCACSKIITANRARSVPYLQRLHREIELQSALFDNDREVRQLHWGGGTPTFISPDQMFELMRKTGEHFRLTADDDREYSIEIDPREVNEETMPTLAECGFNRISLGVQDIDPQVQKAVNRIQPLAQTARVVDDARRHGFNSISMDLIYGLPHQTVKRFDRTLDAVLDLAPDRLAVYNYAHLPEMFKVQRQIDSDSLPSAREKLEILKHTIDRLTGAGYVYIGMDHFARPENELVRAQQEGKLYRNFQGYSTHADCDVIGLGMTSIGRVNDCFSQNQRTESDYYAAIDAGRLPVMRGLLMDEDDRIRQTVILSLICNFRLDFAPIEESLNIVFTDYFRKELATLADMHRDGLLTMTASGIEVLPAGRLLIRSICMAFDAYLAQDSATPRFSRTL